METWEDAVLYGLAVAGAVALSQWFHLGFIGVLIAVGLAGWVIQRPGAQSEGTGKGTAPVEGVGRPNGVMVGHGTTGQQTEKYSRRIFSDCPKITQRG